LHRTYLASDGLGKAEVESPKKLMRLPPPLTCTGAAIRLYPAGATIAVCEGIETALALRIALRRRVWATISAHGMETIEIPDVVQRVIVGADHDDNGRGEIAAARLARRLTAAGLDVKVLVPRTRGFDWADVLMKGEQQ
jgi:putative DNA primase/helicase